MIKNYLRLINTRPRNKRQVQINTESARPTINRENTVTPQKPKGDATMPLLQLQPCTTVGVKVCVYVRQGLKRPKNFIIIIGNLNTNIVAENAGSNRVIGRHGCDIMIEN